MRIIRVKLAGSAVVGHRFYGESGPRFLHLGLKFEYSEVNVAQQKLGLNVQLPFGIIVCEDLDCIPLSSTRCRVNYHCNFGFAKGWRGAITRTIMRRKLDVGPVDSLSRLEASGGTALYELSSLNCCESARSHISVSLPCSVA